MRPYVLSIAGFDPSGGAGVMADIKTFEAFKTLGLSAVTAITAQTEDKFLTTNWLDFVQIEQQILPLLSNYPIQVVKIGLVQDFKTLEKLQNVLLKYKKDIKIIWDPVFSASAGKIFHQNIQKETIEKLAKNLYLVTPNRLEIKQIYSQISEEAGAKKLSQLTNVILKGGHKTQKKGTDILYQKRQQITFNPSTITTKTKHGTGCIFSAAIAASLSAGLDLASSIKKAKKYTERILNSNHTQLGYYL